jgi:tagatose-1,6-bisphosphate aldolase|tara:strand:+ start:6338 stop:6760 length:423 start_codon:yes stop_codon:yes gene_type:complete
MVNIDNIFDLFGSDDNLDGTDNSTTLIDFKNTPTYWIGMYKKLILNHNNFNITMVKFLKKSNKDFDMEDIKDAGEFVTYNRAWSYIKKIDISKKEHLKSVKIYADEYLDVTLKLSINFFIETEEYEKCAHLQKILNHLSE